MGSDTGWSVVPNWVVRSEALQGSEKLLYIALLNRADSEGKCWPSLKTLCEDVGVARRTVVAKLTRLEELGLIRKVHQINEDGSQASNMYFVRAWRPGDPPPPPRADIAPGGCKRDTGVGQTGHGGRANGTHEVLPIEVLPIEVLHTKGESAETLFESVWSAWPKADKKKPAREKFVKLAKQHSPEWLAEQVKRFGDAYTATTPPRYVPALVVWLNQERWTDALPQPRAADGAQSALARNAAAFEQAFGGEAGGSSGSVRALESGVGEL